MVIVPYKYEGLWVFDDAAVDLSKEPFNAGIDSLIDKAAANIPDAQRGFRAIFSARQFPGASFKLEWRRAESDGNWYYSPEFNQEGWLCPAVFRYFRSASREICVKVESRTWAIVLAAERQNFGIDRRSDRSALIADTML